jgi:hypothetical protein
MLIKVLCEWGVFLDILTRKITITESECHSAKVNNITVIWNCTIVSMLPYQTATDGIAHLPEKDLRNRQPF